MDLKKKLKRFFTLTRKSNDGFTLVELIVVIAILAILAGVGSVGYAGYIKAANKKADMALVGNVMRAIETGTYSYSFTLNEVLQASDKGAKLPVGFVVLTPEGGQTMESASTKVAVTAKDACKIEPVTLYKITGTETDTWETESCSGTENHSATVNIVAPCEPVEICTTHSIRPSTSLVVWKEGISSDNPEIEDSSSRNYELKDNCTLAYPANGHVDGKKIDTGAYYESTNDAEGNYVTANNSGAIYESLEAAFGPNPNLALQSEDWTASSIPSFWGNATETWGNVKDLAGMMHGLTSGSLGGMIAGAMDIGQYDSSADIVYSVAGAVENCFADKQAFVDQWASYGQAENDISGGDNFGIDESTYTGREYYSAMRGSYNNCVASYVKQHHSTNGYTQTQIDKHVADLAGYGESAGDLVTDKVDMGGFGNLVGGVLDAIAGENFPRQICKASFTTDQGKSYGGDAANCSECARLYNEYVDSGADKVDAAAVFDTFMTAADTDPMLLNGQLTDANGKTVDFFDFYEKHLAEYEGMYNAATAAANGGSAIVIQVYYEDGLIKCEVSPNAANPRAD